jgi:hypothetical protein
MPPEHAPTVTNVRKLDVTAHNGITFRVVLLLDGQCVNYPAASDTRPLVEFYDTRWEHTPDGQFVSRYYLSTLRDSGHDSGMDLDGGVADWTIDRHSMKVVNRWLAHHDPDPF